jgi:hypothetical protein
MAVERRERLVEGTKTVLFGLLPNYHVIDLCFNLVSFLSKLNMFVVWQNKIATE